MRRMLVLIWLAGACILAVSVSAGLFLSLAAGQGLVPRGSDQYAMWGTLVGLPLACAGGIPLVIEFLWDMTRESAGE